MLPSFLSEEIIQGIKQYLIQGWEPCNEHFYGLIRKYCESEGKLYKMPSQKDKILGRHSKKLQRQGVQTPMNEAYYYTPQ